MSKNVFTYQELFFKLSAAFQAHKMDEDKADSIARILLEGEILGHLTHGLALVQPYLEEISLGQMTKSGSYDILNKTNTTETWDGKYLPGTWLTELALEKASKIARTEGIGTVVIQKSHHIACLAAFLEEIARQNLMCIIACSDPRNQTVVPFGGKIPVYSPNPIAMGIPTQSDPILIDVSMSTTANAVVNRAAKNDQKLAGQWLQTADGQISDDPKTFFEDPPASLLPLGGSDLGYKGFALGVMVEAMTNALCGYGRYDQPGRWGASVFVQVIDPQRLAGRNTFLQEMENLKEACLKSSPLTENQPVRMPGQRGLEKKKWHMENGIVITDELMEIIR